MDIGKPTFSGPDCTAEHERERERERERKARAPHQLNARLVCTGNKKGNALDTNRYANIRNLIYVKCIGARYNSGFEPV